MREYEPSGTSFNIHRTHRSLATHMLSLAGAEARFWKAERADDDGV